MSIDFIGIEIERLDNKVNFLPPKNLNFMLKKDLIIRFITVSKNLQHLIQIPHNMNT